MRNKSKIEELARKNPFVNYAYNKYIEKQISYEDMLEILAISLVEQLDILFSKTSK
jgi:hypothetical protein